MRTWRLVAAVAGVFLVFTGAVSSRSDATVSEPLSGAGSSFVFPLVSAWQEPLARARGIVLDYDPSGSGEGVKAVTARHVDFGASDAPLTAPQRKACGGCVQIPWALSATAVAYNIPGVRSGLRLTGPLIARIFLGSVTRWNDPAIRSLNPGETLPDLAIRPVHRSDASGTSYSFSQYLAAVSPGARARIGVSTTPRWPGGLGAKGSSGAANAVAGSAGAVTYVDVAYALQNRIKFATVGKAAGTWTLPGVPGIAAAAATVKAVPASGELVIVDPPASASTAYPIATFSYVIVPSSTAKAKLVRDFVSWAVTEGQKVGKPLFYVPIPQIVQDFAMRQIATIRVPSA